MLSIIIPFTSVIWAFSLDSLLISSGWFMQYSMCSLSLGLHKQKEKVNWKKPKIVDLYNIRIVDNRIYMPS